MDINKWEYLSTSANDLPISKHPIIEIHKSLSTTFINIGKLNLRTSISKIPFMNIDKFR